MRQLQAKDEHVNWDRVDYLCSRIVRSALIVSLTIASCWGVFQILSHTFGGV